MLAKKLLGATSAKDKLWVDDCFATHLYTGNGSTQTINNGIDLAGEGGLVWMKRRTSGTADHHLYDTLRGPTMQMRSNDLGAVLTRADGLTSFNANGFVIGPYTEINQLNVQVSSWTFRRAKKFFDIVTYTGDGVAGRQIPHDLGAEPGFITTKSTSTAGDWNSYHRSATGDLKLNTTAAQTASRTLITGANDTSFTVSGVANTNGVQYVAYLWAHDDSEDGIIQCGSYVGNGSTSGPQISLGWEPQYLMIKNASGTGNWQIIDSMRGMPVGSADAILQANLSNAESAVDFVSPTATGFQISSTSSEVNTNGATYIYLAIRRPNKPPKSGVEVFAPIARTGTGAAATVTGVGFNPDLVMSLMRSGPVTNKTKVFFDRLRGATKLLQSMYTDSEVAVGTTLTGFDVQDGILLGADSSWDVINGSSCNYGLEFFRRAPGFFDQICYTGTGSNKTEAHNLGKQPELWLAKRRNATGSWIWGSTLLNTNEKIVMPSPIGRVTDATAWNSTYPTDTNISLGTLADVNASGGTYTLYMWATLAGISKVGTYTGNGSSQTIDCGFSTGARFVMIIRMTASTAQDIYLWDSARGITSGNDPRLSLNTTATEVTGLDTIDPDPSGFIVNQDASNVNVSGAQYLYLSIS